MRTDLPVGVSLYGTAFSTWMRREQSRRKNMRVEIDTEVGYEADIVKNMKVTIEVEALVAFFRAAGANGAQEKYWYSMKDCAFAWGLDEGYFRDRKHLLPNFGVFDDPSHFRFSKENFLKWVVVPLIEHEKRWTDLHPEMHRKLERLRKSSPNTVGRIRRKRAECETA
jgi:hypothetical protein